MNTDQPIQPDLVSVVIVNYNTFGLTCKCIESVIEKTVGVNYEIVLVDNASTECNSDLFLEKFPSLILVKNTTNLGFAKGNNSGISRAKGNYILLLNSDTELVNDAVTLAYERMKNDPSIGVLSGKLIYPDQRLQHPGSAFPGMRRELFYILRLNRILPRGVQREFLLGPLFDHESEKFVDWVWGAFFFFRTSDLARFPEGKLHDNFFMYAEDIQWCYYFKKRLKLRVLYTPAPVVIHYIGKSSNPIKDFEKKASKVLPNIVKWLAIEKGKFYSKLYVFLVWLHYRSASGHENRKLSASAWSIFKSGVN